MRIASIGVMWMTAAVLASSAAPAAAQRTTNRSGVAESVVKGMVTALAVLPNGDLAAGARSATAGGVGANTGARWNGSTWAALGAGMNGQVSALAVLPNGDLVAGGYFTTAGGVANTRSIARWNGSTWAPLG